MAAMKIIRDRSQIDAVDDVFLPALLHSRLDDLCQGELYDPDLHGFAVVMEPSDKLADIEAVVGVPLLRNPVTGIEFDQANFTSVVEYVERHPDWYELVVIPGDGDFGILLFIPCSPQIDPRLLAFCAEQVSETNRSV